MLTITREVDQTILIGDSLAITPSDIDARGVRLVVRGRHVGGPQDGETFSSHHELAKGASLRLGPMITIIAVALLPGAVRLGILAPEHLNVRRKEVEGQGGADSQAGAGDYADD